MLSLVPWLNFKKASFRLFSTAGDEVISILCNMSYAIDTYMVKCNLELGVVVHTVDGTDYFPSLFSLYKSTSGIKTKDYNQRWQGTA